MTTRLHDTSLKGASVNLLLKFPALYDNKYVIFYSLWPCCFIPSLNLVVDRHMFSRFVILILIMAGFYDDDDFSLSGLMQEGHDFVTVIESSSDDENYHGLLDCTHQLAGESDKSSLEGGVQGGVMHAVVDQDVVETVSNLLIPKMSDSGLFASNNMPSPSSHSDQLNDVSSINK